MISIAIPSSWCSSAEKILRNQWRKILVIGATDRGKSTYCRFLAQTLCCADAKVAFVDADIGQKDVGPPATISLAYLQSGAGLSQAALAGLYFVGTVTPVGHLLPMTVGTRRLVDAAQASFILIDTTGLVQGSGRVLKGYQIESLRPDVIVTLEKGRELEAIVRSHRHYPVIRLQPSPQATAKSRAERRMAREHAFGRYFQSAEEKVLHLQQLVVQRSLLFNGRPLKNTGFVYAEKTPEGIVAVSQGSWRQGRADLIVAAGFERNLLCGLADHRGEGLGLALVREINYSQMTIILSSPVPAESVKILQFGGMYIDLHGRELPGKPPANF